MTYRILSEFQALVLIPQTASPHHSKLGFSAVSSLPSSLSSTRIAVSSVNNSRFFPEIVPIITRWKKQSPVVRAEANPEEAVVDGDSEENTEENVESDTEASDVAEEKPPPRKPLVKLGDIMGVMYLVFCLAFENAGEICSSDINHSFGGPIEILFYCSNLVM